MSKHRCLFSPQVAVPKLCDAAEGADLLVFVVPHQFIRKLCDEMVCCVSRKALGITLIKVITDLCWLSAPCSCSALLPLSQCMNVCERRVECGLSVQPVLSHEDRAQLSVSPCVVGRGS